MKVDTPTEIEEAMYSKLPLSLDKDTFMDTSSISNSNRSVYSNSDSKDWFSKISQFGLMYFVDNNDISKLTDIYESNTSTIDYKYPENVQDFYTFDYTSPTKDELAVNYVLKTSEFSAIKDLVMYIECSQNDLITLNKFKALKKKLWRLLLRTKSHVQDTIDHFNLMSSEEIEFNKQVEVLKEFIENQNKKISELSETKYHYLRLINDMYFYIHNVKNILGKIKVSLSILKLEYRLSRYNTVDVLVFSR